MGVIEGNRPATDNDWESVKKGGDAAIQKWINDQMKYRSCTVVLVGSNTANRKWINYEIQKSWSERMGVVGIHIHHLKDSNQSQAYQGSNPFGYVYSNGMYLSQAVKLYNSPHTDSKDVYKYISDNIAGWTEEAIKIREKYS